MEELTIKVILNDNFSNRRKDLFPKQKIIATVEKAIVLLFGKNQIQNMEVHLTKPRKKLRKGK